MSEPTILQRFARLLGVEERHAEDALHSERAAKHVLSRRSFFGVSAAMAGAAAFSIPTPVEAAVKLLPDGYFAKRMYTGGATGCSTLTTFDALLKELYSDEFVKGLTFSADPYLAHLKIGGR